MEIRIDHSFSRALLAECRPTFEHRITLVGHQIVLVADQHNVFGQLLEVVLQMLGTVRLAGAGRADEHN